MYVILTVKVRETGRMEVKQLGYVNKERKGFQKAVAYGLEGTM